jgi:Family of unknown function (DUF6101)
MVGGGSGPAGSRRVLRLDPTALPARFRAFDSGADERIRFVELYRERVVLRRAVRGIRMALSLPVSAFLGVAIRIVPPNDESDGAVAVVLEHRDPALSVPVYVAFDGTDVVAEWQLWSRVLGRPLLVTSADGSLREPFARLGALRISVATKRRRRHSAMKGRRPLILFRRKPTQAPHVIVVHRGEREIIARN